MNALVSGKYYRVRPAFEDDFTRYSTSNYRMVDLIKEHGGSFTPTHTAVEDGTYYVSAVEMADGARFDSDGDYDAYFELEEGEFKFFEEVTDAENEDRAEGLLSMKIEVNHQNFEAMIDLIIKNFKK
jgi:hypothetical protein